MKVLIFGATGTTGKYVVQHALESKDQVFVFVRNVNKLTPDVKERVQVIEGDLTDAEAVSNAVKQSLPDAIVVASGHALGRHSYFPLNASAITTISKTLQELQMTDTCRVVVLSGFLTLPKGTRYTWRMYFMEFALVHLFAGGALLKDNRETAEYLSEKAPTGLQFVVVRMGYVVEGASMGDLKPSESSAFKVTFRDMGLFLVKLAHGEYKEETARKLIAVSY